MSISDVHVPSLVAVNVGNTSVGVGVFDRLDGAQVPKPQVDFTFDSRQRDFRVISPELPRGAAAWYVTSVYRPAEQRLRQWVRDHRPDDSYRHLRYGDFPLRTDVEQPESVGADRWAGAVAANALRHPDHGAIVVDAGTAITVNAISAHGTFLGGAILPGRKMSATALCAQTDLLPLVEPNSLQAAPPALGKTTDGSIQAGLYWGTIGAIRQLIHELGHIVPLPRDVFVTGGGMTDLVSGMGKEARFVSDLVLRGIAITAAGLQREEFPSKP